MTLGCRELIKIEGTKLHKSTREKNKFQILNAIMCILSHTFTAKVNCKEHKFHLALQVPKWFSRNCPKSTNCCQHEGGGGSSCPLCFPFYHVSLCKVASFAGFGGILFPENVFNLLKHAFLHIFWVKITMSFTINNFIVILNHIIFHSFTFLVYD